MPLETVTAEQFKSVFGDVPELTQPAVFSKRDQKTIIPFDIFQIDDTGFGHKIGILETSPYDNRDLDPNEDPLSYPDAQTLIRVKYDSSYGLKARTWQAFLRITREVWNDREKEEPELLLLSGNMTYDFGPVSIVLSAKPLSSAYMYDFMLRQPSSYFVSIDVSSASGNPETTPPLARVHYNLHGISVPVQAEFVDAGYEDALQGQVEQRSRDVYQPRLSYQKTYYEWRHLTGATVGSEQFRGEKDDKMHSSETIVQMNSSEATLLKDRPYRVSMYYRSPEKFSKRRLSLVRSNTQTVESWIFSVPGWIDNEDFMSHLSVNQFVDFFSTYPVFFGVRRVGREDQLFRTWGGTTHEIGILNALQPPESALSLP